MEKYQEITGHVDTGKIYNKHVSTDQNLHNPTCNKMMLVQM